MPQRHAGRAREDQGVGLSCHKVGKVRFQVGRDVGREGYTPSPSFRFRRPVEVAATWQLGKRSFYPDCACLQAYVTAPERRQLAPPETAENRQENECPVPRADSVGQGANLAEGKDGTLRRPVETSALIRQGLRRMSPSSVAVFMMTLSSRYAFAVLVGPSPARCGQTRRKFQRAAPPPCRLHVASMPPPCAPR